MESVIEVKNLNIRYNGNFALENISFSVNHGTITVIIGPNGSGKTTLLKALLGLIHPNSGTIKILNKNIKEIRTQIGYVPQRFIFEKTFPITVWEFLKLSKTEDKIIFKYLNHVGMTEIKNHLLGDLSGGELQRILIARAMVRSPKILFLDEPSSGIDIAGEKKFYELVKHIHEDHKITTILVSHELDVVYKFADQVICLNKKMLCQGSPQKVLTHETLQQLYGEEMSVYKHQ